MLECYDFEECEYNAQPKCCLPNGMECSHGVKAHKPTNADRIRAMSDEELVDIFLRADFCKCCEHEKDGVCNYICDYPNIPLYDGCKQAALAWMKQPTKEDTAATALSTLQAENADLRAELERMKKIMRKDGIMVIPSKYPGGPAEWNIPKPRGQKED